MFYPSYRVHTKPAASNGFVIDKNGKVFSNGSKIFVNIDKKMFSNTNIDKLGITKQDPNSSLYVITDKDKMMTQIELKYKENGIKLHRDTKLLIYNYISKAQGGGTKLDQSKVGVPGLHAEVLALNDLYNKVGGKNKIKKGYLQTFYSKGKPGPFPACDNCKSIIPSNFSIITGKTK